MSGEADWGAKIQENPVLGRLIRGGAADSIAYWGYLGPSSQEGLVTLYPSLENLGDSIEIARADILDVEDVPESILLFGAKVVWVRKEAKIVRRRADAAETAGGRVAPKGDVVERTHGRLRMRLRTRSADEDCHSPCQTCRDCSSVCISICRAPPPE